MNIAEKTVLVTGSNRGVGEALVKEALNRGAKRVFAGTRGALANTDPRVTALTLDVTNASQIQRAVDQVAALDVLINNAAISISGDLTDLDVNPKATGRQLAGFAQSDAGVLAAADTLQRNSCEHPVSDLDCSRTSPTWLLDLEGGGAQPDAVPASTPGASRGRRAWRDPRSHRHRYESRLRRTKGLAGVRCGGNLRWPGEWGREYLS